VLDTAPRSASRALAALVSAAPARDGCALVLGDIPSLRELWDDAAIFVDPRDHGALHDVLAALIAAPGLRADLAEEAQRRAMTYSIERTAGAYRHLYRCLVRSEVR